MDLLDADELRFKQVVLNLLSNAVKFTADGGRVERSATSQGTDLVVTVADTGMGVPPEDRERIFESFQQGKRAAPKAEGTGLGLTLSKRIVELHGGAHLGRERGRRGKHIRVHGIPASARHRRRRQPTTGAPDIPWPSAPTRRRRRGRPAVLGAARALPRGAGVEVVTARDGEEGLALIRRLRPAGVVLDIRLPKLDGWDLLALLKADPATASIPVIIVSMLDERGQRLRARCCRVPGQAGRSRRASCPRSPAVTVLPDRDRLVVAHR